MKTFEKLRGVLNGGGHTPLDDELSDLGISLTGSLGPIGISLDDEPPVAHIVPTWVFKAKARRAKLGWERLEIVRASGPEADAAIDAGDDERRQITVRLRGWEDIDIGGPDA
jgi:hypothetical protein